MEIVKLPPSLIAIIYVYFKENVFMTLIKDSKEDFIQVDGTVETCSFERLHSSRSPTGKLECIPKEQGEVRRDKVLRGNRGKGNSH